MQDNTDYDFIIKEMREVLGKDLNPQTDFSPPSFLKEIPSITTNYTVVMENPSVAKLENRPR